MDELVEISETKDPQVSHKLLVNHLINAYAIETVMLTLGAKGSQWFTPGRHYTVLPQALQKVKDTVGAGDAYAAMSAAGILMNLPYERILPLAGEFASCVCGFRGALIQDPEIYQEFKKKRLDQSYAK